MYSAQLLDHFQHPRNAGELPGADATVKVENPACGDVLELSARVDEGRIAAIRFRARGCTAAIACSSALTELVHGCTLVEARAIRRELVVEAVGGLPYESTHASHLAVDALAALLKALGGKG